MKKDEEDTSEIDVEISEIITMENWNKVIKHFKTFSENPGSVDKNGMWKEVKRICPRQSASLPTAKYNHAGVLVSGPQEIKNLLIKEYSDRLRVRPLRPDLMNVQKRREDVFSNKLKDAIKNKTAP